LLGVYLELQYFTRLIDWHLTDSGVHKPRVGASQIKQAVKMQSAERSRRVGGEVGAKSLMERPPIYPGEPTANAH